MDFVHIVIVHRISNSNPTYCDYNSQVPSIVSETEYISAVCEEAEMTRKWYKKEKAIELLKQHNI